MATGAACDGDWPRRVEAAPATPGSRAGVESRSLRPVHVPPNRKLGVTVGGEQAGEPSGGWSARRWAPLSTLRTARSPCSTC